MKRGCIPEKPARVRSKKLRPSPRSEEAWAEFRRNLGEALRGLEKDEYLILVAQGKNYFVQFAGQGTEGMRAEAVSNTYIEPSALLSDAACQEFRSLGWSPPTYVQSQGIPKPAEGSPNFYRDARAPVPCARLAALAVKTLRTIYGIREPGELTYTSFSDKDAAIRFPGLKITRRAPASARDGADGTAASRTDGPPTPRGEAGPQFILPDGQPVAPERVEADLRARVAKCEEALEDAVWQLARFYSAMGRHAEATAASPA